MDSKPPWWSHFVVGVALAAPAAGLADGWRMWVLLGVTNVAYAVGLWRGGYS